MARPRLILHVGPPKTGSTAIQATLLDNRAALQRHGFDYPLIGLEQHGHHRVVCFLRGDAAGAGDVDAAALAGLGAGGTHMILSSESFIYCTRDELARLRDLLGGFAIEVVMFARSPASYWPSHWQELVKHGSEETLIEYLGGYLGLASHGYPQFMESLNQARLFADVFGRRQLRIVSYDNLVASGVDIVGFFLEHLLGFAECIPASVHNASMTAEMTELLRCMNERWREAGGDWPGDRFSAAYQRNRPTIDQHPLLAAFSEGFHAHALTLRIDPGHGTIREQEDRLLAEFGDRVENFGADGRLFPADAARVMTYGARYWAYRFGAGEMVAEMMQALGY
jgi:hypothetical protein